MIYCSLIVEFTQAQYPYYSILILILALVTLMIGVYAGLLPIIRWFVIVILIIVVQGERVGMLEVFGFDDNKSKPCDKGRDRTVVACGCSAVVLLWSCVVLYSIDAASL